MIQKNIGRPPQALGVVGNLLHAMTERTYAASIDWESCFAEHAGWLRLVVLARVGERQAVEEVLQEVAVSAIAAPAPPIDRSKLPAWLYRLAIRQALLYRRRIGRRRRLEGRYADRLGDGRVSGPAAEPDPLAWLLQTERADLVRAALGRLPARDAEILLLKYADGLSCRDLVDRLGLTTPAVEARLHRARGRLRTLMTDEPATSIRSNR